MREADSRWHKTEISGELHVKKVSRNALKWDRKRMVNEDRTSLSHLIHLLKLHIHLSVAHASGPSKGNKILPDINARQQHHVEALESIWLCLECQPNIYFTE